MKKFKESTFWKETFLFTVFLFSIELLFRIIENIPILDLAILRIALSSIFLSFLLEFILSFFPSLRFRKWVQFFVLALASIYGLVQVGFRNFLGIFISIGTSAQMGAVASYLKEYFMSFKPEYYMMLCPLVLYFLFIVLEKREYQKNKVNWKTKLITLFTVLITGAMYASTLFLPIFQNPYQLVENYKIFLSPINSSVAISQFGTSVFGLLDVKQSIYPIILLDTTQEMPDEERKIDDTLWKEIIEEEQDPVLNNLNHYFINREITEENDYTGYFEGKNLIVVMMESAGMMLTNEEYFPNFQKFIEHGWYFSNNYSPRNACATGDNEFSALTSLFPVNTSCTVSVYPNNTYFTAMFEKFNEKGYSTTSYHDFTDYYYPRNIFHLNMGSKNFYDGTRLGIDFNPNVYGEWPSDVELMQKATSIMTQEKPFMSWITTVSAHHPYEIPSVLGNKYYNLFKDTNYSSSLKRYLSKLKVTDDALGVLLDELEKKDLLKDTVIVLFGDHYPYGLSNEDVQTAVDYDISPFYEIEKVPLVIYNSELESQTIDKNTYYMNLLPTLANLFNLDYDPRFYLGEDLFSSTFSDRVVFADGSWQDKIARYNAVNSKIEYLNEETYTPEEIQNINSEIYQKKEMSKLAITSNYFHYFEQKRNEKQSEQEGEKNE